MPDDELVDTLGSEKQKSREPMTETLKDASIENSRADSIKSIVE